MSRAFDNKLQGDYMLKIMSPLGTWTFIEPRMGRILFDRTLYTIKSGSFDFISYYYDILLYYNVSNLFVRPM